MGRADRASIHVTSILNGAFMDMLGNEMPIIQRRIRRVLCWGGAEQPLNFTTKDDVAAYTAAAALDPDTPRFLRISGDTAGAREIAGHLSRVSSASYTPLNVGSVRSLRALTAVVQSLSTDTTDPFPPWQGMQCTHDMFAGTNAFEPTDNDRYPALDWTRLPQRLAQLGSTS